MYLVLMIERLIIVILLDLLAHRNNRIFGKRCNESSLKHNLVDDAKRFGGATVRALDAVSWYHHHHRESTETKTSTDRSSHWSTTVVKISINTNNSISIVNTVFICTNIYLFSKTYQKSSSSYSSYHVDQSSRRRKKRR